MANRRVRVHKVTPRHVEYTIIGSGGKRYSVKTEAWPSLFQLA